jgi:hypothetical protein
LAKVVKSLPDVFKGKLFDAIIFSASEAEHRFPFRPAKTFRSKNKSGNTRFCFPMLSKLTQSNEKPQTTLNYQLSFPDKTNCFTLET